MYYYFYEFRAFSAHCRPFFPVPARKELFYAHAARYRRDQGRIALTAAHEWVTARRGLAAEFTDLRVDSLAQVAACDAIDQCIADHRQGRDQRADRLGRACTFGLDLVRHSGAGVP